MQIAGFRGLKDGVVRFGKAAAAVVSAEVVIFGLTAGPALAQRADNGGGGDAPFAPGINTGLNWVVFLGATIAVFAFIVACISLFLRQVMVAAGAFAFVIIGGALIARANEIITALTSLNFS